MIADASPEMPLMPGEAVVEEAGGQKTTMGSSTPSSFKNDENHGGGGGCGAGGDNNDHHELQFYDPAEILGISREEAFGYLILLTGGAVELEYVAPMIALEGSSSASSSAREQRRRRRWDHANDAPQSPPIDPRPADDRDLSSPPPAPAPAVAIIPDEETTSLAYAAIVDGNVLHACFGLKAAANGRSYIPAVAGSGGGRRSTPSSIFCCFPPSSSSSIPGGGALDALQFVLPRLSRNKARMSNLVEVLMEVRDLYHEDDRASRDAGAGAAYAMAGSMDATTTANTTTSITTAEAAVKAPLIVRIIRAYIRCFAAVVGYHDARRGIVARDDSGEDDDDIAGRRRRRRRMRQEWVSGRIADLFCSGGIFAYCLIRPRKVDPRLEALRRDSLCEIASGFRGLGEDIWQSLENTATESAITTGMSSIEGSMTSVERKGWR
ncbi:hypothetical protein ACHAXA_007066 [Cyclostephanos tholiformis]|uniref:Uncharacterized protein n=1 Tax=Cyclostephanos tholiformis TaxID=382380 RepID=A0ABD3RA29_9STRA